jgi:hypothetical protein
VPLLGPVPEGGTFFCPHCGALYSVTRSRPPRETAISHNAWSADKPWTSGSQPRFRSTSSFIGLTMLNRPDSATATSFAKVMIDIATGKVADREPRAPFFRISTDDVI